MDNGIKVTLYIVLTLIVIYLIVKLFIYFVKIIAKDKKHKQNMLDKYGATLSGTLKHISGLPVAKGVPVEVYYCADRFVFTRGEQEIIISREKITNVDVINGSTARQYLSGAAAGKYVFGGTKGQLLGVAATAKNYLVISYISNGKDKYVKLDTASSDIFALKVQRDFAKTKTVAHTSVEL